MEADSLRKSLEDYENQMLQINLAIAVTKEEGPDKDNLNSLKNDIEQLIKLTKESLDRIESSSSQQNDNQIEDEYTVFQMEMAKAGAIENKDSSASIEEELKSLEGMKCRAPHRHEWGDIVYHNAIISSVLSSDNENYNNIEVKIMFINPTHQEMLPCPYLLDNDCKFSEEQCRYSHGEIVPFANLQEYVEPKFDLLTVGSKVLGKQSNKLWQQGVIKRIFKEKCLVKFSSSSKEKELLFHDILPLEMENEDDVSDNVANSDEDENFENVINTCLINIPSSQSFGEWEKYTKGMGSKLMEKMGYISGAGLGKHSDGRLDPVSALILPAGKSLDHCMKLREKAGGDANLFSVEKKLKRLQRKQEIMNQKAYEREKNKVDVFNFLNDKLNGQNSPKVSKQQHRQEIRKESSRNLNVEGLKVDEDIKKCERDLYMIREQLNRHKDTNSQVCKSLRVKLRDKQDMLTSLHGKATNIKNEQSLRSDKKKLTIF